MGRKVILKVSSCSYEQQDKLLKEIVGVKGFSKVIVDFPQYTVTGDFKTEDLVKAAEKSGISVITVVSNEEFPPKDKAKEEKAKEEKSKEDKPNAIVSASAAPVISKSVTGTIPWPHPNPGAANYYVYVENLNLKTAGQ